MASDDIERYQILEKIGAGGMGTVYLTWDREIEREVALKWLPAYFSQDEHFTERFKREARVVARLEHPHIVPIYDVGENEGRPFIIMRLLKGGTLREQIGKPGFDLSALVKGLDEIGDALAAAHARHIIHRDIKPGNILFDEHGSAFLSDFGIAKVLDSATQLTGSGFIGTPAYMSPEQFIGQSIDGRCDQYALAIVVFESLTGSLPFQGNTAQMMYKHINAEPPEIDLSKHPMPSGFNPVLQKALSKDPDDRYARILDFTTALRIALRQDPAAAALPLAAGIGLVPTPQKPITAPTQIDTPPEEQKTDPLQEEYREGLEAMSRSQWATALTAFNHVLEVDPNYGNAEEFRQQAEVNLSQAAAISPASEGITIVDPAPPSEPVEAPPEPEEDDHSLAAAAAVGLAAAGAAALASDHDKTSLDLPTATPVEAPAEPVEAPAEPVEAPAEPVEAPAEPVEAPAEPVEAQVEETPEPEEDGHSLAAAAAVGLAAAGAAALASDHDKTSLDLPAAAPAEPVEAPVAASFAEPVEASAEDDLEKTSLDLPSGASAAAGLAAAQEDLEKTSLDLPPEALAAAAVDLDKTSLDLPSQAAAEDLDKTSLDLPSGAYAAASVGAAAALSSAAPAAVPPVEPARTEPVERVAAPAQEKKGGLPMWAIIGGVILLLLLCGGGAYAGMNMLGSTDDGNVAEQPPGGSTGAIAAAGGIGSPEPVTGAAAPEATDTAVPEPTEAPQSEPTDEPSPAPVLVVQDTEEPPSPTPTDEPTETPTPAAPMIRVSVSSANLRRGPGVLYRVLQAVFENDTAELIAKNRDGSWYLVMLEDGTMGWVSAVVVELIDDASPDRVEIAATIPVAPTLTPVPPTNTPIPLPTLPPPEEDSGGGSGGGSSGGGNSGGGSSGGGSNPPPVYTAEPP